MTRPQAEEEQRAPSLPPDWQWLRLSSLLLTLESGSRPPGGALGVTSGVPSISAEQMTDRGTFDFSVMRYVPREYYQEMPRGHIRQGDILVVKDGATTGKTCFVDESFPFPEAVVNEHVFICRPNPDVVVPRFLFYWLWSPPGHYAIRSTFQGAAIGGINRRFADTVKVPVAPIEQQIRIAAILSEQMAAVEQARKAARSREEAADALWDTLLKRTFAALQNAPHKSVKTLCPSGRTITYGIVLVVTFFGGHVFGIRRGRPTPGDCVASSHGSGGC